VTCLAQRQFRAGGKPTRLRLRSNQCDTDRRKSPALSKRGFEKNRRNSRLAAAAELVLELLDAASGVDEALFTGESRVRVRSDIADHDLVFSTVDGFRLAATHRGTGQKLVTSGDVDKCDRIEFRMDISFHSEMPSNKVVL